MYQKPEKLTGKFDHLFQQISREDFLEMRAIGGEVPFYISTYLPQSQSKINQLIAALIKKLKTKGIQILEINLYNLSLEIIQQEDDLEDIFEEEQNSSKEEFLETMQAILDVETEVMPAIAQKMKQQDFQVLFITGVGQVFPFIRSHTVLNNLQRIAKSAPTLMFFPGEYNHTRQGSYLKLFNRLKDDNYYRAFNLDNLQL